MKMLIPVYIAALLFMDIICLYHLLQYRGMRRYASGIRFALFLFAVSLVLCVFPINQYFTL